MNNPDLPPDAPYSLRDWLWRVFHYQDQIFVWQETPKGWEAVAFSQLSPKDQATYICSWLEGGHVPLHGVRNCTPGPVGTTL